MAGYTIELTEDAKADLDFYQVVERKKIAAEMRIQLAH